jgi:hypothetical protein
MSEPRPGADPDAPTPPPVPPPAKGLAGLFAEAMQPRADGRHPMVAAIGGVRGIIDSALPTTAFILAITLGTLRVAIIAAVATGVALVLLRLVRRESLEQTLSGLIGVVFAAFIATRLHKGSGFFLPGLLFNIAYAVAVIGSVIARRPVIGYVAAIADPRLASWRNSAVLRRAAAQASLLWAAIFTARVAVQGPLYLANDTGWLGAARLAMGWPLWAVAGGGSVWLMRRAGTREGLLEARADHEDQAPGLDAAEATPGERPIQDAPSTRPS